MQSGVAFSQSTCWWDELSAFYRSFAKFLYVFLGITPLVCLWGWLRVAPSWMGAKTDFTGVDVFIAEQFQSLSRLSRGCVPSWGHLMIPSNGLLVQSFSRRFLRSESVRFLAV